MDEYEIPEQMTAVVLDSYSGPGALRVEQRPVPHPGPNEVLVKVAAAAINPSDLSFLEGRNRYQKPTPVIPGIEGSGTVVETGGGLMARYLNGKRVACVSRDTGDGLWADYMVTGTGYALPLDKSVNLEQGAMAVVNPLTAIALISLAQEGKHKAIINTAAASALGQMLTRLCLSEGIQLINIVRRHSQAALLERQGAQIVLNSSAVDFDQQLQDASRRFDARLAFDAIAGSMTRQLLQAMPAESKVTVYGRLSHEAALIETGPLMSEGKSIDGFLLGPWMAKKRLPQKLLLWRRAQKLLLTDLSSKIRARYALQDAQEAVQSYQNHMTGGKVLFIPEHKEADFWE